MTERKTERQWMDSIAKGNKQAFLQLFAPYEKKVAVRCILLTDNNKEQTNRLIREVYRRAYKLICGGARPHYLSAWLDRVIIQVSGEYGYDDTNLVCGDSVGKQNHPGEPKKHLPAAYRKQDTFPRESHDKKRPRSVSDEAGILAQGSILAGSGAGAAALVLGDARFPRKEYVPKKGKLRKRFAMAFMIASSICLAWLVVALLMRLEILPTLNIGQGWFNQFVFQLF